MAVFYFYEIKKNYLFQFFFVTFWLDDYSTYLVFIKMEELIKLSDIEIIDSILNGNKHLFEIIVRRYNPYLYKIGRSYNYTHEDTQDLMQDSFIDAYKNLQQFSGKSSFKSWLIKIMLHNCFHKKGKLNFKKSSMKEINENDKPIFNMETKKLNYENKELSHILENALTNLPLHYRMVFSLREINGFNINETADILNISETNVKVRLNRAKSMLRSQVEKVYSKAELFEFNLIYCNAIVNRVMSKINNLK